MAATITDAEFRTWIALSKKIGLELPDDITQITLLPALEAAVMQTRSSAAGGAVGDSMAMMSAMAEPAVQQARRAAPVRPSDVMAGIAEYPRR